MERRVRSVEVGSSKRVAYWSPISLRWLCGGLGFDRVQVACRLKYRIPTSGFAQTVPSQFQHELKCRMESWHVRIIRYHFPEFGKGLPYRRRWDDWLSAPIQPQKTNKTR
jgi:hypothetical protein